MYYDEKYKYKMYLTFSGSGPNGFLPRKIYAAVDETKPFWVETVYCDFDPKEHIGDGIYLIVVRYETGNSFGRSPGQWYVEGVYNDSEEAIDIAKSIKDNKYTKEEYPVWKGYFETLEGVEIHKLVLKSILDVSLREDEDTQQVSYYDHTV